MVSVYSRGRQQGLVVAMMLAGGLGVATATQAANGPYATAPDGSVIKNPYGECWQGVNGVTGRPECGDTMPVMDADGDGVPDDKDRCPDTPKGVAVDGSGCPLDRDGDGVPDHKDRCPGTPAGVAVDPAGCPLDSDGDGVADYKDRCPGTPKGAKVNENGCEIIGDVSIDLVNDEFAVNSARLKPAMMKALDDVAARLKATPGKERLLIVGHTDSSGEADYNQGLSERRANAVADYLASQGIERGSITTRGMGESSPIASNATRDGRAKNRRVDIKTQ